MAVGRCQLWKLERALLISARVPSRLYSTQNGVKHPKVSSAYSESPNRPPPRSHSPACEAIVAMHSESTDPAVRNYRYDTSHTATAREQS